MLRNEEHKRLSVDLSGDGASVADATSLSKLKNEQFLHLRSNYKTYTPWVRLVFCFLSMLVTLLDVMLFFTLMYFHITLEKIIAASIAVLTWYMLYRVIYVQSWSPGLPGENFIIFICTHKLENTYCYPGVSLGVEPWGGSYSLQFFGTIDHILLR